MGFEEWLRKKKEEELESASTKKEPLRETKEETRETASTSSQATSFEEWLRNKRGVTSTTTNKFAESSSAAYNKAKNATQVNIATGNTMSDDDRETRRSEINSQLTELTRRKNQLVTFSAGASRGNATELRKKYDAELMEVTAQIDALNDELEALDRPSTISRRDQIDYELEDAKEIQRKLQTQLSAYSGEAGGRNLAALSEEARNGVTEKYKELNAINDTIASLEREAKGADYVDKYSEKVYDDNFFGQFGANYRTGRITQDLNDAFNAYLNNPTEANREYAYTLAALANEFQGNNAAALDDEGAVLPWVTQSAAGHLPQLWDQTKAQLGGGALGLALGSLVGNPVKGAEYGASIASGIESYGQMRGAAYRTLLEAGVDEETALAAANDEALVSALIEAAGSFLSFKALGGTKALNLVGNAALKSGSKNAAVQMVGRLFGGTATDIAANAAAKWAGKTATQKALSIGAGYVGNIASEGLEERLQEGVSIANENRDGTGKLDLVKNAWSELWKEENQDRLNEATAEGMKISAMFGGLNLTANTIVSKVANAKTNQQRSAMVEAIKNDSEALGVLIDEGKASGDGSVSAQIATEIEEKVAAGQEVTTQDVGRLIAANEVYIEAEKQSAPVEAAEPQQELPETIEQVALEAVMAENAEREAAARAQREVSDENVSQPTREEVPLKTAVNAEEMTLEEAMAAFNGDGEYDVINHEAVKQAVEDGSAADVLSVEAQTEQKATQAAYEAGKANVPREKVNLETTAQEEAYNAGRMDHIADMGKKENTGIENAGKREYTEGKKPVTAEESRKKTFNEPGISDISTQLSIRDVATVDGIKYTLKMEQDGKYRLSIDRDTSVMGGYINDARANIYKGGPFETRGEAVQEAIDVARAGGLTKTIDPDKAVRVPIKEDVSNGEVAEVSDEGRVADRADAERDGGGRSLGSGERADLQSAAGAVNHVPLNSAAELDNAISRRSNFENGKQRIADYYKKNPSPAAAIEFLKKEYGTGGASHDLTDGTHAFLDHDAKGLTLRVGGEKHTFTWKAVEKRIRALVAEGKYLESEAKENEHGLEERSGADQTGDAGTQAEAGNRSGVSEESSRNRQAVQRKPAGVREKQRVTEDAAEYDVPLKFVKSEDWPANQKNNPAYTANGEFFVRENFPAALAEQLIPHEAAHAMRQLRFAPYLDFLERVPEMLNKATVAGQRLLNGAAEHREIDLFGELTEEQVETLYDEVNALASSVAVRDTEGVALEDMQEAFFDYDAYKAELKDIHQRFKDRNNGSAETSETAKTEEADVEQKTELATQENAGQLTPQRAIAEDVLKYIQKGKDFTAARLFEIADKHFGGTMAEGKYTVKDAYDGMELAVNLHLMQANFVKNGNGSAATARNVLNRLTDLLTHIPTQTKRTAEQESYQQFSTPPNIAYLAAWAANVASSDVVLEPSAGIGGLALWGKAWGAKVYGNELSERRLAFLNELGLDGTFNHNAEQIDNLLPDSIKPSVVIMNPPFSSTAGRTSKNDTANAKRHIQQALDRLQDGGRLVAILGNGMANDAPAFKGWWDELRRENSIRANIRLDGENYRKYGTTFDVQLVVIDKTGPQMGTTITGTFKDLAQVPGMMEGIRNDRTRETAARGVLHDGDSVAGRDSAQQNDAQRDRDTERSAGTASDVRRSGKQSGKAGKGNPAERDGRADGRGDSGSDVRGVRGRSGDQETVRSGAEELGKGAAGPRMALSGRAESDLDGKSSAVTENPDSVYATYTPKKVHISGAKKHPARLVESAAMAAVEPPDVTYTPHLPAKIAQDGILSDAQLENVVYAGQAHSQKLADGRRKGYFIGDGTGVGKGRQLAGIIMDNFVQGRKKAVWISASTELINDAKRDWKDLGGKAEDVLDMKGNKLLKNGIQADSGILFGAYSTLANAQNKEKRFKMLRDWLGEDFDGVIALDEAHKMGNSVAIKKARGKSKPSQQALTGIELQKAFPNARIVYASATGATDISQYGYLERLGLWGKGTAFNDLNDFISKISNGGLAAMELVARDMKSMGVYMARSISYDDVTYDTIQHDLNPMQTEIYNTMSRAWQTVFHNMQEALKVTGGDKNGKARGAVNSKFYGTQQRFYDQIITSMSVPSVIEDIRKELANGRSCVIQLVNTNEAQATRAISKLEDEGLSLDDLDLTPSEMLADMVRSAYPVQEYEEYTDERGNTQTRPVVDGDGNPVLSKKALRMREALLEDLKNMKVPDGPLEMLIDAFGVDNVAEVTGRSQRVVEKPDANGRMTRTVERRNSSTAGTADSKMFQDGKKRILIFSQAGGTGFSYHADLRAKNQQQRVHYLLQAGWSASDAVQGFGRTHRSNQKSAPIVRLVTTNVMGQKRFTSTIARRLDQLGALTKGQRQAGSGVFSEKDNLENPIAADALATYYKTVDRDVLRKLGLYDKLFDEFGSINESAEDLRNVSKFLNRILSLEVEEQNRVFQGFYDTFDRMMDIAIANGTVDMGLENYKADKIEVKDEKVIRTDESGADTKYVQMQVYNKPELVNLAKAKNRYQNFQGIVRTEDGSVRAVYEISSRTNPKTGEIQRRFKLEGPVKGKTSVFVESTLKEQTKPIDKDKWADAWKEETAKAPKYNESTLHLLTGTLLPIWDRLPANNTRVMRVLSSDGKQYLGRVIRADEIDGVLKGLGANRTMQSFSPAQVMDNVLGQGKEVVFRDNKMRLTRRRVSGEWRMELTGQNVWYLGRQFPGLISERINYEYRYFVPTGANGEAILADIMKLNPVVDIRDSAPAGDVDYMLNGAVADHSGKWTAKRVGSADKTPMRLSEIVEKIRHDFGINITTGHIRGAGVLGQYDRKNQGIRTKIANYLPTVAHELGHHLDTTYDLTDKQNLTADLKKELIDGLDQEMKDAYAEKKWPREGLAEFIRKYLQNRETAAIDYPKFTKYFLNSLSASDAALVAQLADEVNAYYALDADTATSSIRLREEGNPDARTFAEKIKEKASVLEQAWTDANKGIKLFDESTGSKAYTLANNAAYSDAMAGQIIVSDLTDANGQYVAPGLKTALHGINLNDKTEYRLFGEYLTVKHGPERLAEGMRIFADDRKNSTAFMERRAEELEQKYPQFKEAAERLYQFQSDFLQTWGVNTGLVSKQSASEWADRWEFYVPLNRAVSEEKRGIGAKRGFANQNSTIKKARGSGLDIVHPVDNIVNNIVKMVNAGVRNNVMRTITDSAEKLGANAEFLEKVPTPMVKRSFDMTGVKEQLTAGLDDALAAGDVKSDSYNAVENIIETLDDVLDQYGKGKAHGDVITVMKGGKQEFWKINDPLLLQSITTMSPKKMEGILDAYAVVSRFMTSNITGNNIIWSIFSNFPRDLMTMFTYSKTKNPFKVFKAMGEGYVNKIAGGSTGLDPMYREYLAMGGGSVSAYTADRNLAKNARKKLAGKKFSANPLDWLAFVSETVEMGPRYATYKLLRENGMNPQEAFAGAMDITVNFRRGGRIAREINKVIPFFNVSIQGLDKFRRWITAEDAIGANRKKVVRSRVISFVAVSAALAAINYAINNGDDEDEKNYEQLSNYQKNSYWNIPLGDGKYFAIPKPRELGVLSSFMETAMEYGIGENAHAFDEFYDYASDNLLPKVVSDIAQLDLANAIGSLGIVGVGAYMMANRDFLGKPIVSAGLQNLEPKDQYTNRTSKIAYWVGQAFNESPMMIDYFFQQTLGGFWKLQKALLPVGGENIDKTIGIQGSYVKDNQYTTDLVNWMYDQADKSAKAKNSNPGDMDAAITAKMDSNMTTFYSHFYGISKDAAETNVSRGARQTVLDMIREYQKATDSGYTTPAQDAVYAIARRQGSTETLPSVMQTTVKDGSDRTRSLSPEQYVEYQTDYLRLYWEYVESNLDTRASANEQLATLKAAKEVAMEKATERTLSRIGAPSRDFSTKYAGVSAENVIDFMAGVTMANEDGSVKKAEVVDVITSMDLDNDDAWTLYFSKYESKAATEAHQSDIAADLFMIATLEMDNIKPDYKSNGKEVEGSRRKKVEAYLNSVCDTYRDYLFLLAIEYPTVKKDADYIAFFGRE